MRALLFFLLPAAAAMAAEPGSDESIRSRFPLPEAMASIKHLQTGAPVTTSPRVAPNGLDCEGSMVFAATPGQFTKKYHADAVVIYNAQKVPGTKEVSPPPQSAELPGNMVNPQSMCRIPQKNEATNPATGDRWCLGAKFGRYTMMSDLFFCSQGQDIRFYRGYWESASIFQSFNFANPMQTFRTENEHVMTTSLARGDSMTDAGDGVMNFIPGATFGESRSRFLFFTRATDQEILDIDRVVTQQTSPAGPYERCPNGTFRVKSGGPCAH